MTRKSYAIQWTFSHADQRGTDKAGMWNVTGLRALTEMLVSSQIWGESCLELYQKFLRFHPEIMSLINLRLFMAGRRFLQTFWVFLQTISELIQNNNMPPSMQGRSMSVPPVRRSYQVQAMKKSADASTSWGSIRWLVMVHQGCLRCPACAGVVKTGCYRSKENRKWKDFFFLEGYTARD